MNNYQKEIDQALSLLKKGNLVDAEIICREILSKNSSLLIVHNLLGILLYNQGRDQEAVQSFENAIDIRPDYVDTYSNIVNPLNRLGELERALKYSKRALEIDPSRPVSHNNHGNLLRVAGFSGDAFRSYTKAIELAPNFVDAYSNRGNVLGDLGSSEAAIRDYRKALKLDPNHVVCWSNFLYLINHSSEKKRVLENRDLATKFGEICRNRVTQSLPSPLIKTSASLRVGFVSGDFRSHPVGFFLEDFLFELQARDLELIAYPTVAISDELTKKIKPLFSKWRPICGTTDEAAAKMIKEDNIHILFDLSGHTNFNRLPLFAWKAAPIQVTWLGYFATTGISEMDYLLGDPYVTPATEEHHFTETIIRMPESYLCFTPPNFKLEVNSLPAASAGFITFGCFNSLIKLNDQVIDVWAKILKKLPGSKLFLKTKVLVSNSECRSIIERFSVHGIEEDRLILEGWSPRLQLLESYHRVDIALDPFPYPGGTTSAESLWMGVPVLTMGGYHFLSHVGESIVTNAGLPDWVAMNKDHYVDKAIRFASNSHLLSSTRDGLRSQVLASPLFDAARFAQNFESITRDMWKEKSLGMQSLPSP